MRTFSEMLELFGIAALNYLENSGKHFRNVDYNELVFTLLNNKPKDLNESPTQMLRRLHPEWRNDGEEGKE